MKIVVLGYLVRGPLGGASWHFLQYVLGLKLLGHEVLFLEGSDSYPSCYDPSIDEITTDPSFGTNFINDFFSRYDLQHNWSYYDEHANRWWGVPAKEVNDFCKKADVLLNIANVNTERMWWRQIPIRVLLDTDPAFTQLRHLEDDAAMATAKAHTHYFSFGENIGKPNCKIPADGFEWKPTRQPVVLPIWDTKEMNTSGKWTTVMQWDSYKERYFNGQSFGMKSVSFKEFESLPGSVSSNTTIELALGSASAPHELLRTKGWQTISSLEPTKTPFTYVDYIAGSKGEWSVAKHGYVVSNSGWFSERSCCYLASGRPIVVQETGFSEVFGTGIGVVPFTNLQGALAGIEEVTNNYKKHALQARKIVEEVFDSSKVLRDLLAQL